MATDFYGRVRCCLEAFFIPLRLCYGGFQQFITQPTNNVSNPNGNYVRNVKYLPCADIEDFRVGAGTLSDYLGLKVDYAPSRGVRVNNLLPFVAYHLVWSSWYRESLIQTDPFMPVTNGYTSDFARSLPYLSFSGESPAVINPTLADNTSLFSLRQRNFSRDYFTNAKLNPQAGTPSTLAFNVSDNTGSFTISSLRAANSLQQWLERNNLAGSRYIDQIRAHYGVTPSDAILDRPIYLGSHSFDIYNKGVNQTGESTSETNNPMSGIAAKYGSSMGVSDSSLVEDFQAKEFGILMVLCSIVPDSIYGSGTRRYLDYQVSSDFANPLLSSVGDQVIKSKELSAGTFDADGEFGYTQRYSEYKFMLDEVHGLLRDGSDLESFVLQRTFDEAPSLGSQFLQIPTTYMDQVTAVTADMSKYGAWCSTYFKYKKSSVLPAYSIPTLGDPKDTHTEIIPNGGVRL